MKVKNAMHRGVCSMPSDAPLASVADRMRREDVGAIAIVDDGVLVGIVTDRDIVVRGLADRPDVSRLVARDVMSEDLVACEPNDDVDDAARRMAHARVRRLPVLEHGRVVGMLSLGDVSHNADEDDLADLVKAVAAHHS